MNKVELKFDDGSAVYIEVIYDYAKKTPLVSLTACNSAQSGVITRLTDEEARMVGEALYVAALEANKK